MMHVGRTPVSQLLMYCASLLVMLLLFLQRKPVTELKGTTVITHHFEGTAVVRHSSTSSPASFFVSCCSQSTATSSNCLLRWPAQQTCLHALQHVQMCSPAISLSAVHVHEARLQEQHNNAVSLASTPACACVVLLNHGYSINTYWVSILQGSPKHGASSKAAGSQQLGGLLGGGLDGAAAAQALGLTGELDPRLVEQVLQVRRVVTGPVT
jgi:hypothetical protein